MNEKLLDFTYQVQVVGISLMTILFFGGLLTLTGYILFLFWKYRNRKPNEIFFMLRPDRF